MRCPRNRVKSILPQALRIVLPPMTSHYITIIGNTTLAGVVGYPDIAVVIATMVNQTGQAVEGILILRRCLSRSAPPHHF